MKAQTRKETVMKIMLTGLVLVLINFFGCLSHAHEPGEGYGPGPWMMYWGHGAGWWIFPLVMIVIMVIFCFLMFGRRGWRSPWCDTGERGNAESPLDILNKRYAKGEIGREEFEEKKQDLTSTAPEKS